MNPSEKAALAALEKHGNPKPSRTCTSCQSPWVEAIDLLLRLAAERGKRVTRAGFYESLKDICPDYPMTDSGLRRHLQRCRSEQAKKALG